MKILVFSDSHKKSFAMEKAIRLHQQTASYVFHLGDGTQEFRLLHTVFPALPFVDVSGNYEDAIFQLGEKPPSERVLDLDDFRFFLSHGHQYGVKSTYDHITKAGIARNADVVLFGHTHTPYQEYIPNKDTAQKNGIWLFCPGSIGAAFDCPLSYGIIEIKKGSILLSNATIE